MTQTIKANRFTVRRGEDRAASSRDRHFHSVLRSAASLAVVLGVTVFGLAGANGAEKQPASPVKPTAISALSLFSGRVLAKGKGVEVKQGQIDDMYIAFKANRAALGLTVPPESMRAKIESDLLEKSIATQLILSRATAEDKVRAKEIAEQFIAEQMKQAPSEESFNRQLLSMGMKPEVFRAQIGEQAIVEAVIDREIKSKKVVTEADAKNYYEKNPQYFQEPELVRVSHILFSTQDASGRSLADEQLKEKRKLAEKVLVRARGGADFKSLVKEFSEDEPSKERGGEYVIAHAKDDPNRAVVPEFEGAAFSLATNQISDIVTTKYGYHIIKGHEKIATQKMDFAKVEAKIRKSLQQEEAQKELPAYVEKLKKEAGVEIIGSENKK